MESVRTSELSCTSPEIIFYQTCDSIFHAKTLDQELHGKDINGGYVLLINENGGNARKKKTLVKSWFRDVGTPLNLYKNRPLYFPTKKTFLTKPFPFDTQLIKGRRELN